MKFSKPDYENSKLLYLQVAESIEKKILSKEIGLGQKIPPERQLSKTFAVSIDTVKEALSRLGKDGYISRRRSIGTIVINSKPAGKVALRNKNEICVVVCTGARRETYGSPSFHVLLNTIEARIKQNNLHLLYRTVTEEDTQLDFNGKEKDIAGLIILGNIVPENLRLIKKTRMPFILVGDVYQKNKTEEPVDILTNDDFDGTYAATKHLIAIGHKRIACFAPSFDRYYWEQEHLRGYIQALKDAGIERDNELIVEIGSINTDKSYAVMKDFLKKSVPFTGLVCLISNNLYFAAMKAFNESNIRVPEDVSIVGAEYLPGLTYVSYNIEETGGVVVGKLIERLTNPQWQPQRIVIPNKLYIGGSTEKLSVKKGGGRLYCKRKVSKKIAPKLIGVRLGRNNRKRRNRKQV